MKNWLICFLCVVILIASSALSKAQEVPRVNIPQNLWKQNWAFSPLQGSCVHAAAIMLWRWQGQHEWAEYWGSKYYHGEYALRFHSRCDIEGVDYCDTWEENDFSFLEWAIRTRRGALVAVQDGRLYGYTPTPKNPTARIAHAVCLVHLDTTRAGILDSNDTGPGPGVVKWVDREAFLADWINAGSWAWTPVSTPPAPPQLINKKQLVPLWRKP